MKLKINHTVIIVSAIISFTILASVFLILSFSNRNNSSNNKEASIEANLAEETLKIKNMHDTDNLTDDRPSLGYTKFADNKTVDVTCDLPAGLKCELWGFSYTKNNEVLIIDSSDSSTTKDQTSSEGRDVYRWQFSYDYLAQYSYLVEVSKDINGLGSSLRSIDTPIPSSY